MNGFFLLLAHMLGDFVLQSDWMAKHKINKHPGKRPGVAIAKDGSPILDTNDDLAARLYAYESDLHDWWWRGNVACTVHCLLYTLATAICSWWWMPWWGYAIVFGVHWPIDRFGLAGRWMRNVSGQNEFASNFSKPNLPYGVIIVDNTFHLLTFGIVAVLAGQVNFSGAP